jgi:hypothetical protein
MSERSVMFIRRAAKRILSDNRQSAGKRLRGGLLKRQAACRRASDLIALTVLNREGREWGGRSESDDLVFSLRAVSTDVRMAADARLEALEKLAVLDGLMSADMLGHNPQDCWIRSLVEPKKEITATQTPTAQQVDDLASEFSDIVRK